MPNIEGNIICFAVLTFAIGDAIPVTSFYSFGPMAGDSQLVPTDDDPTPPIQTPTTFWYYNSPYNILYVNNNGILSFTSTYTDFTAQPFPLQGVALVAPYWADVDTRLPGSGLVWYRTTQNATLLARAKHDIPILLTTADFTPQWLFIATWDHVGYYYLHSDKTDTFQCVLITDGHQSFVMFLYADGLIQWTTGDSSGGIGGLGGTPALVGFNAGDGTNYAVVPSSQTPAIINITFTSNVGVLGLLIYRVNGEIESTSISDVNSCYTICQQNCSTANGSFYCSCSIGYELGANQKNCTDIDECSTISGLGPCQQNCTNTIGSYFCSCSSGYILGTNQSSCIDIDECIPNDGLGPCQQNCTNTIGSYFCSCSSGYMFGANQPMCIDIDECSTNDGLGSCQQNCTNTIGSYFCSCSSGYTLGDNQSSCIDIDECSTNGGLGLCQQNCTNTIGSYFCSCSSGYNFVANESVCIDIDECSTNGGLGPCQQNCTNTIGSYFCSCSSGYIIGTNQSSCIDIDECIANGVLGPCQQNCTNTIGSYFCNCSSGCIFGTNESVCIDINECLANGGLGPCQQNCTNTIGSYFCSCNLGYSLGANQSVCIDIDECSTNGGLGPCQQNCTNAIGSYLCSCNSGYILGANQSSCIDLDECIPNGGLGLCQQICTNTIGSYLCSCTNGYRLATNRRDCNDTSGSTSINQPDSCNSFCLNETEGSFHCSEQVAFIPAGDICNSSLNSAMCLKCPCTNGGLCKVCSYNGSITYYICQCPTQSSGQYCENKDNLCTLLPTVIIPTTVLAFLLYIFCVMMILISRLRRKIKGKSKTDFTYVKEMDMHQETNNQCDHESAYIW